MTDDPTPIDLPPELAKLLRLPPVKSPHYVPQFYLEYWLENPLGLAVMRPREKTILSKYKAPRRLACADNFYAKWPNPSVPPDQLSQIIEHGWHSQFETQYGVVLPALCEKIRGTERLTERDKFKIAWFMSLLRLRGPAMRKSINGYLKSRLIKRLQEAYAKKGEQIFVEFEAVEGKPMSQRAREIFMGLLSGNVQSLQFSNKRHIELMVEDQPKKTIEMMAYDWVAHVNRTSRKFITSDNPVSMMVDPAHATPIEPSDQSYLFPMSPDICIVARGLSRHPAGKPVVRSQILRADEPRIDELNCMTAASVCTDAYASSKSVLVELLGVMPRYPFTFVSGPDVREWP